MRVRFRKVDFAHGYEYIEFWSQPVSTDPNVVRFVALQ
jgi:hypothetical protein